MAESAAVCYPLPPLAAYADDFAGREPDAQDAALWTWLQVALYFWRIGQLPDADRAAAFEVASRALGGDALAAILADVARRPMASDIWGSTLSKAVREGAEHLERVGAFRLAYSLLTSVRAAVQQFPVVDTGLVILQQGRIARSLGAIHTAHEHYTLAERLGQRAHDGFLLSKARLGRGILAATRGNYPAARVLFRRALNSSRRAGLTELEASAHNGLLMAAVAAKDIDAALRHGWGIFRGAAHLPERQAEVLVNLAEVALLAGHPESALNASLTAVRLTTVDRLHLAGYGTAAIAASRLGRRDILDRIAGETAAVLDRSHQHVDRAYTLIELAEAYAKLGADEEARQFLVRGRELSERERFFELVHRAEVLARRMEGTGNRGKRTSPSRGSDDRMDAPLPSTGLSATSRKVIRSLAALGS